ncbi:tetratricopeptide repeat protein [Streptomyces sp. NBC_01803]|uniref:tetratricopeptide repeat protein n=1 Tax=Streptomyces sp. NBC_01803 TaxID=2975946 RepID=UPI002DD7F814|nr:tetratricopeptide repeat protein [Streptomyces sp. NBC_01803]WSA45748.1 tetratricopeptide repeat protein [Streptomyces sp. NBC_01803]
MINKPPAALPPTVLERADVRSALAHYDFGELFRLANKYGGISFKRIGDAIGVDSNRVSKYAHRTPPDPPYQPSYKKVVEIADGLRIPGYLLALGPRPWESDRAERDKVGVDRPIASLPSARQADRSFTLAAEHGPWEVMELARRLNATDISPGDMDTITLVIDRLCRSYPYMPAEKLHEETRTGIRYVTDLLNGRTTLKQHRELLVSAGWLFLLGGCLEYDMGQREAADLSRATAFRIGQESGHSEIVAWSFELGAWFSLTQGQYSEALDSVESGHRADSTHSVGVQLYAQSAKSYARVGNARQVRDALDAGRARLERLPRPEHREHHFVIDPEKWDFYEMDAYRMLGDDDRASTHANEVIRLSTAPDGTEASPMRVAEARLTLGVAAARAGELEEAVAIGERALQTPRKSLPSLLLVAGELSDELVKRYPREALTQDFRNHLRELVATARPELEA